jgi:hypothetical protein
MAFNTDDSSASLGLGHGATFRSPIESWVQRQQREKAEYLREIGIEPSADDVNAYLEAGLSHDDAREAAVNKKLSIRPPSSSDGEVARRMQKYITAGYGTIDAIAAAEAEMEREAEGDGSYLGASIEDLMRAPVEPSGGGSKSKGRKSSRQTDPTVVAQGIIRRMAA